MNWIWEWSKGSMARIVTLMEKHLCQLLPWAKLFENRKSYTIFFIKFVGQFWLSYWWSWFADWMMKHMCTRRVRQDSSMGMAMVRLTSIDMEGTSWMNIHPKDRQDDANSLFDVLFEFSTFTLLCIFFNYVAPNGKLIPKC